MIGAMTALITPFKDDGSLDKNGYEKLIKRQIEAGIDVIVPVGTTGESATLTHNEHKECIEIAVSVAKGTKTKVLAGAGSNNTLEAIDLAKFAQKVGADGILSVTPYYNKPTQTGLYEHYKKIATSIDIPVVLYNVPGRTSVNLENSTIIKLFEEVKNIIALKEATGKIENVVDLQRRNRDLIILSGDDAINYPILASGGKGVISVTANLLPGKIKELVDSALNGDYKKAKEVNEELYELNKILFIESNPIPIKVAMEIAGLTKAIYRLPLVKPSKEIYKRIEEVVKKYL